ncbi:DUF421 domain-containing protein [Hymenobacter nivis]|uniref:DUF421 domain-containing protein n=1 Tax=Hymenobacter nivis TaxID=1850093 RepID=A0A502GZ51_9BACT|nr:YetF domain-containing protein [Hymenobacter nivis]TPG66346.1 DUF421 domain-containing protein [Hymenobacter nivis]
MKKEEIHLGDWQRILLGNAPLEFLLEAALRTLVIYLVLLATMRLLGKRMNGQLSVAELSVMIMLGGIVSVPMQTPDRGILQGALVLACLLGLFRFVNWLAFKYRRVEHLTRGDLRIVVTDGVLDLSAMADTKLSREQLFANLRAANMQHLGQLKRVYMESNGEFSLYPQDPPRPGLSILPDKDAAIHNAEPADPGQRACQRCGHTESAGADPAHPCPRCGHRQWTPAVNKL